MYICQGSTPRTNPYLVHNDAFWVILVTASHLTTYLSYLVFKVFSSLCLIYKQVFLATYVTFAIFPET